VQPPNALASRLQVDFLLPFRDDGDPDVVHGWLALRDAAWSDGLSDEERRRLEEVVGTAGHALANLASLRRLAEERRLAGLGTMSAGLAHEIRNPLAGLKGAAQILEDEPLSGEAREMIEIVLRETDRLDKVVSSFLSFARPVHLDRAPMSLARVADHAVRLLRAEGLPTDVQLTVEAAPVPDVLGDEARLGQVVINLLRNARDAVGARGRIEVRLEADDDAVVLSIADDGPGIDPGVLAQLRTPFFTTKASGTGLGLAISDRIVTAHGGALAVRSAPGEGATVSVRLPVAPAAEDAYSGTGRPSLGDAGSEPAPGTNRLSS
jgi:signal transduction histidine kinase